jgi:hypothetical protein
MACSGSTPTPQAYAKVTLSPGPNVMMCPYGMDQTLLTVGGGSTTNPTRVQNGSQGDHVECTVHQSGDNFDVNLDVGSSGSMSAELIVTGQVTSQGSTNLSATFSLSSGVNSIDSYGAQMTCTFTPIEPTASTRIWGTLRCPTAVSDPNRCEIDATILFEYCGG